MSFSKVAVIFDDKVAQDSAGFYCRRALGHLVEVEYFPAEELSRIPPTGFDLYLNIDDGLEYRLPADLRPCAWWVIDPRRNLPWYLAKGKDFDRVFTAQRADASQFREGGIASASWLPLACDPDLHRKHDVQKTFDLSIVGPLSPGPRADLVDLLRKHFASMFVGQNSVEEMARTYSSSRVVFNRSIRNDVNACVFTALACGSLLLTDDLYDYGQDELFRDGLHLATYRDPEELLDKAKFYLRRESDRERVAAAGRAEALARHTYRHRMETLLEEVRHELTRPSVVVGASTEPTCPDVRARETTDAVVHCVPTPQVSDEDPKTSLPADSPPKSQILGRQLIETTSLETEARRGKHSQAPLKLYGLMITKDDHDVFREWCEDQLTFYDAVVCLDGSETARTERIAAEFRGRLIYLHERDYVIPRKTDHGLRRVAHREIVRRFGTDNWVMCCHADEFCYHDPRKVAVKAAGDRCDAVAWFSLQFLPHPDELSGWDRLRELPVTDRVRHYHWGYCGSGLPWLESRLYRNGPRVAWDRTTHGNIAPHNLSTPAPFHPILRHYKVFTTDLGFYQGDGRSTLYRTHWAGLEHRTGLSFRVERPEDFFVRSYQNYDHCDRFNGTFNHPWNMGEEYRPDANRS